VRLATDPRSWDPLSWDPLHQHSPDDALWTTTNVGEAMPGVVTPLTASLWVDKPGRGLLETAVSVGAFTRKEATDAAARELFGFFYGHAALRVEFFARLGDRLPGTSGREVVVGVLGRVPEGMRFQPTRRRYPMIAAKFLWTFLVMPRRVRTGTAAFDTWWRNVVERSTTLTVSEAVALLQEADAGLDSAVVLQTCCALSSVSPVHDAVVRLIDKAGRQDLSVLLSPIGGAEMGVISDLWAASRDQVPPAHIVHRHGFHGPNEGEVASLVWRDDPTPVHALVAQYRDRGDSNAPVAREGKLRAQRERAETELLAVTPRLRRPLVALILGLARTRLPLRGLAKRSVLQSTDVARIAARRIGQHLAEIGTLDHPDDVFYLTRDELITSAPVDAKDLVTRRRQRREFYLSLAIPSSWQGNPPTDAATAADSGPVEETDSATGPQPSSLTGIGVSPGIVEGICRVVHDPDFGEVEPDEILVAPTTDPGWSSIMFVSAGLVVDIGGALSHAAVVARELGLPCVVNTRNGSSVLRTGDRIRIDGTTGVIERLPA
jgi:pyruvate,water dikinase